MTNLLRRLVAAIERIANSLEKDASDTHEAFLSQQEMMAIVQKRYEAEEQFRQAQYAHMAVCEKAYLKRVAEGTEPKQPIKH